jgi:hypothetical protein
VVVQFNPTFMEISVDGASVSQRLPQGGSRFLDLADTVYVGGIELNKRSRALGQGLLTADTSFKVRSTVPCAHTKVRSTVPCAHTEVRSTVPCAHTEVRVHGKTGTGTGHL